MPELPEVETVVNDLKNKIIGRKIKSVWFDASKLIKRPKLAVFVKEIRGLKIGNIKRRAKNILIYLSSDKILLVHQKMTGHLLYGKWLIRNKKPISSLPGVMREKVNDYIHLIFYLDNGWQIALSDLRKFAKVVFGPKDEIESLEELKKLGPEPLERNFDFKKFQQALKDKKGKIKQVLMDQTVISGIGNIYSDEILWLAKIHPFRPANQLKDPEMKKIFHFIKAVLKKAVKLRGTSVSDFRDPEGKSGHYANQLYVYQREGEKCPRCQGAIKRLKMGSRSAHFCPNCQKL
jgi:formamidopyrimidine-DNA glycosylase